MTPESRFLGFVDRCSVFECRFLGAVFSSDFGDVGDFGGLGWSWVVLESRFLGFVDRCNVFEGPGERESLWELVGALELANRLEERTRTFG